MAAQGLAACERAQSDSHGKHLIADCVKAVSLKLGNTPAVCRSSYIHPEVMIAYLDGSLFVEVKSDLEAVAPGAVEDLLPEEVALLALLRTRSK